MARTSLIAFRLEERHNRKLRAICQENKISMSDFIRAAVIQAINQPNFGGKQ